MPRIPFFPNLNSGMIIAHIGFCSVLTGRRREKCGTEAVSLPAGRLYNILRSHVRLPLTTHRSCAPTVDGAARCRRTWSVGTPTPRSAPPPRGHTRPGGVGTGRGRRCTWGAAGFIGHPEGARSPRPPHRAGPCRDPSRRAPPRGPPGVRRRRSGPFTLAKPLAGAAVRPASLPVVTRPPVMAAPGGARLLRAVSTALGGAARRWLLLAGPRAAPGRGGGAVGLPRTLSVSAPARSR